MARPAIGSQISVAVPADVAERIDAAAEAEGVSRSVWVRAAINSALNPTAADVGRVLVAVLAAELTAD